MSSLRRTLASRANGARSRGPKTPQGKERSAQNASRHGLLARCIVLQTESTAAFQAIMTEYIRRFQPADDVEMALVEEMAAAFWRQRRCWAIETRLFDNAIETDLAADSIGRIAGAFSTLADAPSLALTHRYETRLHNMYQRALRSLVLLRAERAPKEPNPDSEHGQDNPEPGDPESAPLPDPVAVDTTPAISASPEDVHAAKRIHPAARISPVRPVGVRRLIGMNMRRSGVRYNRASPAARQGPGRVENLHTCGPRHSLLIAPKIR